MRFSIQLYKSLKKVPDNVTVFKVNTCKTVPKEIINNRIVALFPQLKILDIRRARCKNIQKFYITFESNKFPWSSQ